MIEEEKKEKTDVLEVRDRLGNILDLTALCQIALMESQHSDIKVIVSNVLYFQVIEQIKVADRELKNIYESD